MNVPRLIVFLSAAAVLAAPGAAPASLVDGMVVHYTFDDPSDLGADALGNHPGTLNAGTTGVPTYSSGSQGVTTTASHVTGAGAISFEGVNGYVNVADWTGSPLDTATGPGQPRTVSFWFQSVTSATEVILEKGTNLHFVTHYEPLRWRVTASGGSVNVLDPEALRDGNWHHYAGVHAGGRNYLYIDGVYQGQTVSPTAPAPDNNPFVMGARVGPLFPFEGKLDDVAIWNRQLSPAEINLLVRAGRLGFDVSEAAELQVPGVTYQYGTASTSQPHATYPDIGGAQLTDGYRLSNHTSSFTHPGWVGFRDDDRSLLTPHPEVTFDLHGSYLLDEIWILYLGGNYAGIMSPDFVLVSFSDDGQTFSDPLEFAPFSEPGAYSESNLAVEEAVIKLGGRTASHVRLEFRNEAQWTFLGEVAFVTVPEPNTVLLLALGGLWLLAGRRCRRRRIA